MTEIQKILKNKGPLISSALVIEVAQRLQLKINTASQQVTRSNDFERIGGFFKSNQSICFLPEHVNDSRLFHSFHALMKAHAKKYWYTLNALKVHAGACSREYLECYTNYPIIPLKGHIPFAKVMDTFIKQDILVYNGNDYIFSPRFSSMITNPLLHRNVELIKDKIIDDFHSLSRNTGIISYNSGEKFGEFGKFRWGFKAVSPIRGLKTSDKFGFVLADVLIGHPFYIDDLHFFIEKLNHIQSFKNASRIFPIMLIDDMDPKAFQYLKANGVVLGLLKEWFGEKYADTLKQLIAILNNAGASLKKDPDKYLELITQLKKYNDGLANNIRGTLFEFVVGHIHRQDCQSIDLGREIIENGSRHDMDIQATYSSKIVIAECKAEKSLVSLEMAEKWISIKIPAFRNWILRQETLKNKELQFEYWSTSGYTVEAMDKLKSFSDSVKIFKVSIYGPIELRQRVIMMKNKKLKDALDNFFLKTSV